MAKKVQLTPHLDTAKKKNPKKNGRGTEIRSFYNSAAWFRPKDQNITSNYLLPYLKPSNTRTVPALSHCPAHGLLSLRSAISLQDQRRASDGVLLWDWQTSSLLSVCGFFSNPLQIASMLCDAYKTAPSKFAVFPIDTPTHLIDASLRHGSQSIALDFVWLYQYGCSHPPPASLSLFFPLLLVWMRSRFRRDEV